MKSVVCVKTGNKYDDEYVKILYDSVKRNTTVPFRFHCFSDDSGALQDLSVSDYVLHFCEYRRGQGGWWNKLRIFENAGRRYGDRVIYFDLDTMITGNIDWLMEYDEEPFAAIENLGVLNSKYEDTRKYKNVMQSGIMTFDPKSFVVQNIASHFEITRETSVNSYRGDGEYLNATIPTKNRVFLQHIFPNQITSYKYFCYDNGGPGNHSIVCFHGEPGPKEACTIDVHPYGVTYKKQDWVKEYWRTGE